VQKIVTFLWFDNQAEEAARYYVSIFPDSEMVEITPVVVQFRLAGQAFMALNGGAQPFKFNESISLFVRCEDQAEVDRLWTKLTDGGEESQCGWLKDRYGLSWQIIPKALGEMLGGPDSEKAGRAMQAMLKMGKIDVAGLRRAYERAALS